MNTNNGRRTAGRGRVLRAALALGVAGGLLAGAAQAQPTSPQPKPVRVGLVAPLSGPIAGLGESLLLGAEMAVKEINEAGGYLGRPLQLVVRDDKSSLDEGRRVSEDLVLKERVAFTLGFCSAAVGIGALDIFQKNSHVLIVPCAQATGITSKYPPAESFVFRVAPTDVMNARFLAAEVAERRKLNRIAILADATPYGDGGLRDLLAELSARRIEPVFVGRFAIGTKDLTSTLRAARDAGAEALIVWTLPTEQAVLVRNRLTMAWNVPYFSQWALSFPTALEAAGAQALEGTMMTQTFIQDSSNERRTSFRLRAARQAKSGRIWSLMAAGQSYDAMHLMLFALFQTRGDTSGKALKDALENQLRPYYGVVTTYDKPFSSTDHDAYSLNMLWLAVWRQGEVQFHYPSDARQSAAVRRKSDSAVLGSTPADAPR
jgi:branched-chain amino acid transport system substrate-binding protein